MIYFAKREGDGLIKIGKADDVYRRMYHLEKTNKCKFTILATRDGSFHEERFVHNQLSAHRHKGEFFYPHDEVLSFIDNLDDVEFPEWDGTSKISFYVSQELNETLKRLAKEAKRTKMHYIEVLLEQHAKRMEKR